ncbi:hypothetical protein BDB00DRAFT_773316 [Zychaea mexicana]|uniref:uncharacterized protein n=1 Tax=Zychaea mexicana TaxID=64656 RepID=UPI0022FF3555|nr:uncharacterized protein BDB00DRAFT_773316 [Zychaea mexicana]KAI9488012.1 hypothetical protein BDB00DRAFT_773316 [Zychaea mexicana]
MLINEFAVNVSNSKPCRNYNDGQMFLDMKLENKLNENDCIAFDGGYYYYIKKSIDNCDRKGNDKINLNNFMFNNNESTIKVYRFKIYNVQIKLSLLLLNIQKFCQLYNIPNKPNHLLWVNENFDYPNPNRNNNINSIIYEFDILRITDMTNQQDAFI